MILVQLGPPNLKALDALEAFGEDAIRVEVQSGISSATPKPRDPGWRSFL